MEKRKKSKKLIIALCIIGGLIILWTPLCIIANSADTHFESPEPLKAFSMKPENEDIIMLCTFIPPGSTQETLGVLVQSGDEERILPLQSAYVKMTGRETESFSSMINFIADNKINNQLAQKVIAFYNKNPGSVVVYKEEEIQFLPPIPRPIKVVDSGTYTGHYRNMAHAIMKKHVLGFIYNGFLVTINWLSGSDAIFSKGPEKVLGYYVGNNLGIYGNEPVIIPKGTEELDIEPGFALVISKNGKDIDKKDAQEYIAGYLLYNDFTDRTIQAYEFQYTHYGYVKSKVVNSMGPFLVTGINIKNVVIRTIINGKELPVVSTFDMYWSVEDVVSYISSLGEGVACGEIIGLGCLTGGSLFERGLPELKPGDTIELVGNQGFGILKNTMTR